MSRVSDVISRVNVIEKCLSETQAKQCTISADLYGSIKEMAELKYRIVEMEVRIGNLEAMVKILTKGEVQ